MNFIESEYLLGRLRCRQWNPLVTQQLRLRHVNQVIAFNLSTSHGSKGYYFTMHLTSMSAPFYTSETAVGPHAKWGELDIRDLQILSTSTLVLRVWQKQGSESSDLVILTWGLHLSGLVYLGNKTSEILPQSFKPNTVILNMFGGFFTNHNQVQIDPNRPSFSEMNLTGAEPKIFRKSIINASLNELQNSYSIDKLRKLHSLQLAIKNKSIDVQTICEKIHSMSSSKSGPKTESKSPKPLEDNVRYEPQLLTMNSLNRMLHEKPTPMQKEKMIELQREIEILRFRTKMLSQERDKKLGLIRNLKQKFNDVLEKNEEDNSELMEMYHALSRDTERLKEYKRSILHHQEIFAQCSAQLHLRRKQLLQQLLFIYPIEKQRDNKYIIHGIYLPNSDVLTDCSDVGLSVALGYVSHILVMCSSFLQVPLRYPLVHYGSRSRITDNISPLLPERDFPLYSKGKERVQFPYAVYLLNKNLAQLRWLFFLHTPDLKATLPNLLSFLDGSCLREPQIPSLNVSVLDKEKIVSLNALCSSWNICDPILESIRQESHLEHSNSPKKSYRRPCPKHCGKGLGEILAVPEAFLNKQISSDSFKKYASSRQYLRSDCCGEHEIKITKGCDGGKVSASSEIEEGTDPLDPSVGMAISRSIKIKDAEARSKRLSRSVGSYTDEDNSPHLRNFEMGSEPVLNLHEDQVFEEQHSLLDKLLGSESVLLERETFAADGKSSERQLTDRTEALLVTKSFNLVKPKQ